MPGHAVDVRIVDGAGGAVNGIQGPVASGATASGNPVPIGGDFNTVTPTISNGQRGTAQITSRGALHATLYNSTGTVITSNAGSADGLSTGVTGISTVSFGVAFNGTTWDRLRGNTTGLIVIPPAPWTYAAATGGIDNTTTAVTVKAAAGASVRNYVTKVQIAHATLGASTEFAIRDGAGGTVLWRTLLHTTAMPTTTFDVHLQGTANTLLEVVTLTAVTGDVLVNLQGYTAP